MLAKEGFDDVYGARPLRRAIQRKIEDGLSVELLEGKIKKGDTVTAVLEEGKIKYVKDNDNVSSEENKKENTEKENS